METQHKMDLIKRMVKTYNGWLAGLYQFDLSQLRVPQQCYLCHQPSDDICCAFCQADLPHTKLLRSPYDQPNLLHNPKLKTALAQPVFQQLLAPMRYRWPVSNLMQDFKYHRKDKFAALFADWMLPSIREMYGQTLPDILVPVPIHPLRQLRRYYNQAELLTKSLSQKLDIPVSQRLCKRIAYQRSQTRLSGKARRNQLQNAFAINENVALGLSQPMVKRIVIVDDVITTGSTANAVARILKHRFPWAQLDVWAVAISA